MAKKKATKPQITKELLTSLGFIPDFDGAFTLILRTERLGGEDRTTLCLTAYPCDGALDDAAQSCRGTVSFLTLDDCIDIIHDGDGELLPALVKQLRFIYNLPAAGGKNG